MTTLNWLLDQMGPHEPGLWLAFSLLTGLALIPIRRTFASKYLRLMASIRRILIPYLALLVGAASPRLMGIQHINWATSFSLGLALLFGVLLILSLVRATTLDLPNPTDAEPDVPAKASERRVATGHAAVYATLLLSSGLLEWHWAFLRGATWEMALSYPNPLTLPAYWAIWVAAGLALVDLATDTSGVANWFVQLVALLTTSVLFFYTHNFWLCWLLHSGIALILRSLPQRSRDTRSMSLN